jgi:hypothetical protein
MSRLIVALIGTSALLCTLGCERWALDRQMEELCRKDGGIKVYETVSLPAEMFESTGRVKAIMTSKSGRASAVIAGIYLETSRVEVLKAGDPLRGEGLLQRARASIERISDGYLLAESIQYQRAGGDMFVIGHHTQAICPDRPMDLQKAVFKAQARKEK